MKSTQQAFLRKQNKLRTEAPTRTARVEHTEPGAAPKAPPAKPAADSKPAQKEGKK